MFMTTNPTSCLSGRRLKPGVLPPAILLLIAIATPLLAGESWPVENDNHQAQIVASDAPPATHGQSAAPAALINAAWINGSGPGWKVWHQDDFVNVNCAADTWTWKDGQIQCTGQPVGVIRSTKPLTNFELVIEWRHLKSAGNSGVFLWATKESIDALKPGGLPMGIEVQILDHGYSDQYRKNTGKEPDWFTTNGDVFPTQAATMTPFPPVAPNGKRSFPTKNLSRGVGEWNHYYVRAINGEVRLWVNGEEVSGGTRCSPSSGYLCLESEGSPIEFRNLKIRELP